MKSANSYNVSAYI